MSSQAATPDTAMSTAMAPTSEKGWWIVGLHIVLSRLIYEGAFVVAAVIKAQGMDMVLNRDHDLPSLKTLWAALVASGGNYGDYSWYKSIADWGYAQVPFAATDQQNWAFFPLQGVADQLAPDPAWQFVAGLAAFTAAVLLLFRFLRRVTDGETALITVTLICYFPFSFVLSEFRPESFMFLASVLALVFASNGQRWDAAAAAAVAGLAKPNAFLLAILLMPFAWKRDGKGLRPTAGGLAMVAAPASGVALMSLWLWRLTGEPLAWIKIQKAWQGSVGLQPLLQAEALFRHPQIIGRDGWDPILLNWVMLAFAFGGVILLSRNRRWVFAIYALLYGGLTFLSFGVYVLAKHLSTCFPLFVGWSAVLKSRPAATQAVVTVFSALLAINGVYAGLGFDYVRL